MKIEEIPIRIFEILGKDPEDVKLKDTRSTLRRIRKAKGPQGTVLILREKTVDSPKTDAELELYDNDKMCEIFPSTVSRYAVQVYASPIMCGIRVYHRELASLQPEIWGIVCDPSMTVVGVIEVLVGQLVANRHNEFTITDWWSAILNER